jgi:hypothetical protein
MAARGFATPLRSIHPYSSERRPVAVMLSLAQAAELLGYSTSGLRKLVRRGDVRYFQARPHAPLKFRQEWLDDFIECGSQPSEPARRQRRPKPAPPVANRFGL